MPDWLTTKADVSHTNHTTIATPFGVMTMHAAVKDETEQSRRWNDTQACSGTYTFTAVQQ